MKRPQALALATVVGVLAESALAAVVADARQGVVPQDQPVQVDVRAQPRQAMGSTVIHISDATRFVDAPVSARATEIDHMDRTSRVVQVGDATVFIDTTGTRTRDEVRAEASAALRSARRGGFHAGS